jgi:hypothetical protein
VQPFDQLEDRAMAEEPGTHGQGPGAAGRARASASGKLHGAGGHGQERRNSHGANGGGLGGRRDWWTKDLEGAVSRGED